MGYKKILEKRKEMWKLVDVKHAFMGAVEQLNEGLAKVEEAKNNLEKTKQQISVRISALETGGVKEFDQFKAAMIGAMQSPNPRPLPLDPVKKIVSAAESEVSKMMAEWENKLAAAIPKDIKPGMTFKMPSTGTIFEVTEGPLKSTNPNLKGDDATYFKTKIWKDGKEGGDTLMKLPELKKLKYLNT